VDKSFHKFYKKTRDERLDVLQQCHYLSKNNYTLFKENKPLDNDVANSLIENQLTQFPIPLGAALNFVIDGEEKVIPMVVEEPSVVAACSYAAKLAQPKGFNTSIETYLRRGQIILTDINDSKKAMALIDSHYDDIKKVADNAHPSIVKRGGGLKDIQCQFVQSDSESFFTIFLIIDV